MILGFGKESNYIDTIFHTGEFRMDSDQNTYVTITVFPGCNGDASFMSILYYSKFPNTVIKNSFTDVVENNTL